MGRLAYAENNIKVFGVKTFIIKLCKNNKKGKLFNVEWNLVNKWSVWWGG